MVGGQNIRCSSTCKRDCFIWIGMKCKFDNIVTGDAACIREAGFHEHVWSCSVEHDFVDLYRMHTFHELYVFQELNMLMSFSICDFYGWSVGVATIDLVTGSNPACYLLDEVMLSGLSFTCWKAVFFSSRLSCSFTHSNELADNNVLKEGNGKSHIKWNQTIMSCRPQKSKPCVIRPRVLTQVKLLGLLWPEERVEQCVQPGVSRTYKHSDTRWIFKENISAASRPGMWTIGHRIRLHAQS